MSASAVATQLRPRPPSDARTWLGKARPPSAARTWREEPRPRSVAAREAEDVLAEVGEDQVVRDGGDGVEARLAELALDVVLFGEPEAAVGVEARVRGLPRRLRGEQLREVRLRAARLALLEEPGCLVAHQVGGLDRGVCLRNREWHGLVLAG